MTLQVPALDLGPSNWPAKRRMLVVYIRFLCAAMASQLQVPALDLGPPNWPASDARFAAQLSAHLGGPLSSDVLAAFQAMLRFQGGQAC